MTNYELVKNMSVEEMAEALMCPGQFSAIDIQCKGSKKYNCYQCTLDWLTQEQKRNEIQIEEEE